MKLGSLFDGIGGWQLAAVKVGITPIWSSEIEKFPQAVTARYFPNTKQLGDITKIDGTKIETVDIICMGSPCQDLSIAGKREGLDGERSGLFRIAINIIRAMRTATNGKYPRFVVWENVPGAFSSNRGNDFRTVLEEITETKIPMPKSGRWAKAGMVRSNRCEVAWRVPDSQYWGVPQRRKRIFLVADFGGRCASKVLFEPESVSRYITQSSSERKRVARNIEDSIRKTILFEPRSQDGVPRIHDNICPTLNTAQGGQRQPCVVHAVGFKANASIAGNTIDRKLENGGNGKGVNEEVSFTLNTIDRHAVVYASTDYSGFIASEITATLKAKGGNYGGGSENLAVLASGKKCTGTLLANCATKQWLGNQEAFSGDYSVIQLPNYIVRRLTPTECERLQGLPDGYTAGGSDTARYKALGNGMAQPCADFVMQGIAKVLNLSNSRGLD